MAYLPGALVSTLSRHLALSNSRLETMVVIIVGLVNGRTVNLSHIASQFHGPAHLASNYRRLQRFFQFVRLDEAWFARALIGLLNLRAPFTLCLDRTNWKVGAKDINLLVLCIAARRVRIPILWSVLDAGSSNTADRKALVKRYMRIFGAGTIGILLADREFIGNRWFEFLVANDIPFAIRVRENLAVTIDDGRTAPLASLTKRKKTRHHLARHKGCFVGMSAAYANTMSFIAKRRNDGTMIILATNCEPKAALSTYRRRWQIECLFGDTKTRGFNMEDTRLTRPAKLHLLMTMVTLALAWAHACASRTKGRTNIERASHGHRRKSWFRTGLDALRHWILCQPISAATLWDDIWWRARTTPFTPRVV